MQSTYQSTFNRSPMIRFKTTLFALVLTLLALQFFSPRWNSSQSPTFQYYVLEARNSMATSACNPEIRQPNLINQSLTQKSFTSVPSNSVTAGCMLIQIWQRVNDIKKAICKLATDDSVSILFKTDLPHLIKK
jgi:hypothetical protein